MDSKKPGKRHAAHLSLYPDELLPFLPVDVPDNQYGKIHTPIKKDPYMNAGLKGFEPIQPHKSSSHPAMPSADDQIKFSSLAELNAECFECLEIEEETVFADHSLSADIEVFATTRYHSDAAADRSPPALDPPPPIQALPAPHVPDIGPLTASILASNDRLFLSLTAFLALP